MCHFAYIRTRGKRIGEETADFLRTKCKASHKHTYYGGGNKNALLRRCVVVPPIASNDALGKGLARTKQGYFLFFSVRFDKQSFFPPNGTVYALRACVFRDKNADTLRCIRFAHHCDFTQQRKTELDRDKKG